MCNPSGEERVRLCRGLVHMGVKIIACEFCKMFNVFECNRSAVRIERFADENIIEIKPERMGAVRRHCGAFHPDFRGT